MTGWNRVASVPMQRSLFESIAVSQRKLTDAWTKRELLGKVLEQQETALSREQERIVRKREDEIATQSWMAGRTA